MSVVDDYGLLPVEASGMRTHDNAAGKLSSDDPSRVTPCYNRRAVYRSFSDYIANEAPPHYREFYVAYSEGKELIKILAAMAFVGEKGGTGNASTERIRRMLNEAHQVLVLRSSSTELQGERVRRQLCEQLLLHDMLGSEIQKCNQFAALTYRTIEQALRVTCVRLRQLTQLDKQRQAWLATSALCENSMVGSDDDNDSSEAVGRKDGESSSSSSGVDNMRRPDFEEWRLNCLANHEFELEANSAEIAHLDLYTRVNFKGLVRLATLFDKTLGTTTAPWTQANVMQEYFANVDIDNLLVLMSVAWRRWRTADARLYLEETSQGSKWKPPESFVRNTTKYWIRPDQVVRTKLSILRHMPYLIFDHTDAELDALVDPYSSDAAAPVSVEEGQLVSSIYFDSESAWSYNRRLTRLEGAELVRFRWYGENRGNDDKEVFIERKTHHEQWSGESSTKERFPLPQSLVKSFMHGTLDVDDYARQFAMQSRKKWTDPKVQNVLRLGHEIQDLIVQKELEPMVRTSYLRSAFQLSDRNDVRFSLDVNLCMVDERRGRKAPGFWCRVGEEICGRDQVVRFPYAVLEVKLQTEQPPWVSDILVDVAAVMVYKFSKFQHGMAFLHRSLVQRYAVPHWIPDFEREGFVAGFGVPINRRDTVVSAHGATNRHAPSTERLGRLLFRARQFARNLLGRGRDRVIGGGVDVATGGFSSVPESNALLLTSRVTTTEGGGVVSVVNSRPSPAELAQKTLEWMRPWVKDAGNKGGLRRLIYDRSKNVKRNDPKSFFAAERTLLHYVQKGLYLGGLATALLSVYNSTGNIIGLVLGLTAIFIIGFSWVVFWDRCERLNRRVTKTLKDERERVDSTSGPVVLFATLLSAILVAIGLNFSETLRFAFGTRKPVLNPMNPQALLTELQKKGLLDVDKLLLFLDRLLGNSGKVLRPFSALQMKIESVIA